MAFLQEATRYFARLRVPMQRLITDQRPGVPTRPPLVRPASSWVLPRRFTRPYRPQTNGEAERAIQSALRQWAYGRVYQHSDERRAALPAWDHRYNWHRRHHGIGCQRPMSRLSASRKNLVILHT